MADLFQMVTCGKFNVDQIATSPLFVVRFNQVGNVHAMQFTHEVKQFSSLEKVNRKVQEEQQAEVAANP